MEEKEEEEKQRGEKGRQVRGTRVRIGSRQKRSPDWVSSLPDSLEVRGEGNFLGQRG